MEAGERLVEASPVLEQGINVENTEKALHEGFMREALAMAELALSTDETPVGCVLVHNGVIIGRGMNATNRTMNGTRHAEFMAIAAILSIPAEPRPPDTQDGLSTLADRAKIPKRYTADILKQCDLYVTVEPCIMCASLLRQYEIRKVYYGANNERFGGTGGVLKIHEDGVPERKFEVSGGWLRDEAILLLRRFYVQENGRAPESKMRKKERKLKTEIKPINNDRENKAT